MNKEAVQMCLELPKSPDSNIMKMLIRASQFIEHARVHAQSGTDFDNMISIHNLDNAMEYMIRILIRHLEIEEKTGKTINTCELAQLIGEVSKFLKDNNAPALSYVQEIKMIRELRNMVQHAMINPQADIMTYLDYGDSFFDKSLQKYFGINREELKVSTLVEDDFLKEKLKKAETFIFENKYLDAIVEVRDAFDYAKFIYTYGLKFKAWSAPALTEIKKSHDNLYRLIHDMDETIQLNSLNIDMNKYAHYSEYIACIPREYQVDWTGNTVLQREWNKQDADFCYSFVANLIVDWESKHFESIHEIKKADLTISFSEKINGVETRSYYMDRSCEYLLDGRMARLFYLSSKDEVNVLEAAAQKGIAVKENKRFFLERMQTNYTELTRIYDFDSRFIMNDPSTWEVIFFYEDIPFTRKNKLSEDEYDIAQGPKSDWDDTTQQVVKEFIPLVTAEKAKELYTILLDNESKYIDEMYCSTLVENLSKQV